jgi:hypothetical protein
MCRRYYLHRRARMAGYRINSRGRYVSVPGSAGIDENKYVKELVEKFRYKQQLELL